MKMKKYIFFLTLLGTAGIAISAPKINEQNLNLIFNYIMQSPQLNKELSNEEKAKLREDLIYKMQYNAILKEQAIKVGLDKRADTQALVENAQAEIYAARFMRYLGDEIKISNKELENIYQKQTRLVRLQQVAFETLEESQVAYDLLKKGLSFEELMKRFPNPQQSNFNQFIAPTALPPEFAQPLVNMTRGEITSQPIQLGKHYFILKLMEETHDSKFPPFEQVKQEILQQEKQLRVQQKIKTILDNNGLTKPSHQP